MIFDLDNWKEIYSVLTKNKLRTFLTAFGVFWGIAMLVIMLGSGNGLKNGVTKDMKNFSTNSMFLWCQTTSKPYKGYQAGRRVKLTLDDIQALKTSVPEIEYIAPRNQLGGYGGGNNVFRNGKSGAFSVMADFPDYFKIDKKETSHGRLLNEFDIEEKRKVVVIGPRVKDILFEPIEDPIGQYIRISGIYFKVIGVTIVGGGRMSQRDNDAIYMPFTTFKQAFNYGNDVSWMALTIHPQYSSVEVDNKIKNILKERQSVSPDDKMAYGSFNAEEAFGKMKAAFTLMDFIVWLVGIFTLIAGIVGISNIMVVVVKERTQEIGVRRAIGAKPSNIITQIMMEATVLSVFSGYLGLVFGIAIIENYTVIFDFFGWNTNYFQNPEIKFGTAIKALILLVISGAIAGLIPAFRAVKIKPIEALRTE
jgi:putative ABC transport system permease protein